MIEPQLVRQWFGCSQLKGRVVITLDVKPPGSGCDVVEPTACSGERACGVTFLSSLCPYGEKKPAKLSGIA
jgi:hypothetical protein